PCALVLHSCPTRRSSDLAHVLRGRVKRVVPRPNDSINETWISDRDRFSCYGLYTEDRLTRPLVKVDQEWTEVTWQQALEKAASEDRKSTRLNSSHVEISY